MIDLGRAPFHAEGVTLFPDHAEADRFHVLPDRPTLRRRDDGAPELALLKYHLDPTLHQALGAGMLSFTVDLSVDDELLARLGGRLQNQLSLPNPPRLGPVIADSGSCQLMIIDRASDPPPPATTGATAATATDASAPTAATGAGAPATGSDAPATGSDATATATGAPATGTTASATGTTASATGASATAASGGSDGPALVERILGGASPSLFGDNAATFMVVLAAEGVTLVEDALRGGGLPVGVVYDLTVLGIRPAVHATVTAHWDDVYHYYENRLHGGKLLFGVDIGTTVNDLIHHEAITISVDELVPSDERDPAYQRALDQIQQYILTQFFTPTLGQSPPASDDKGDGALPMIGNTLKDLIGFFSINYTLQTIDRTELKTLTYRLDAAQAEKLTLSPQGTLSLLLAPPPGSPAIDVSKLITVVEPSASPEMDFDVGTAIDLDAEGIDHLEVTLRYGERTASLILDGKTPRAPTSFYFEAALGLAVRYGYEVHFKAGTDGPSDVLTAAEVSTEDRVIRVDPRSLYQQARLDVVAQGVPFDRFPTVIVDLQAADLGRTDASDPTQPWSGSETLQLSAAQPEASWQIRGDLADTLRFQRKLRYVDVHGDEHAVDWDSVAPGVLVVGDPFPDALVVQIVASARFGTVVARVIVEVRPTAHPDQVSTFVLTQAQPFATWSLALPDREDRSYEYRVTVHTVRAEVNQGQWLAGTDGTLVVGEGIARLRDIQLLFVGKNLKDLASRNLLGIKVRFAFDDGDANLHAEDERLVQDASAPVAWSYPVATVDHQSYSYQLSWVHSDGTIDIRPAVTTSDLLLLVPLP